MIRVVLADDHPVVRSGIRTAFAASDNIQVVAEVDETSMIVPHCQALHPDVLLLDLRMPGPSPLTLIPTLHQKCPGLRVLVMSAYDDLISVQQALAVGAIGYIRKDEPLESLIAALRIVAQGGSWFSDSVLNRLVAGINGELLTMTRPQLVEREQTILQLVVQGRSDQEISQQLGISERTVRYDLRNIYDKLNVTTRIEAAVCAVQLNLF